jgi:glycine/D-amino acid oxidase-like deaminating enzyme/nitrite reductase/ring-hydroxylating ferredoxin subunit
MNASSAIDTVRSESVWAASAKMPRCASLRRSTQADVCIVGAGIAGLTTGYLLTRAGKSVVILDDGDLAGGMTEVTTAHLTNAIDDRYFQIEWMHGLEGARLAAESHAAAVDQIEAIAQHEKIACDFARVNGFLFLSPGEKEEILDRELAAARRAGLRAVEKVGRAPLDSFDTGPCLRFPNQGQFHPLKYLADVARAIKRDGGRLFTNSHVDRIEGGENARVSVGKRFVSAKAIVVATNAPINDLVAIHTKQAPYMTYVIGARVPAGSIPQALLWDTGPVSTEGRPAPYHYVRLQRGKRSRGGDQADAYDVLIVGGEDHKSGQQREPHEPHAHLEVWARERFPMIQGIEFAWGGQVMETIDGLAFIGRNPLDHENVFVVTGDSGMGMTHGTIAGMLLTDLILGHENRWAKLYDPSRKTLRAAGMYAKEAINMAAQYADWLTGGDVSGVDEIAKDNGAVLRRGMSKVAVYRDEHGKLHEHSAVCGHLGCIVQWNSTEKTWDCPCHGSRFTKLGKVINGPANSDLAPIESS